ncbi:MAG: tetratricopeptide repeat protein [Calditrichaeota bacterium]|nr:tetratricopeptide repeat protein [Calditrichota bacterium]
MNHMRFIVYVPLFLLLILAGQGHGQTNRMIGILSFTNEGPSGYQWVARGIEELLYDKLAGVSGVSVYEKETLTRILEKSGIKSSATVDAKSAFSIGKATGIQVLFLGSYQADGNNIVLNFKMVSTYTGSPIYQESFTGSFNDIFSLLAKGVKKGLDIMVVTTTPEEIDLLDQAPTTSIKAFESYCKAFMEAEKGASLEVVSGYFERALLDDPGFLSARYHLGVVSYNARLYDKALAQFNTVIQQDSRNYRAYFGRGVIYFLQRQNNQALTELKRALVLNPDHDRSYYYLGITYTRLDSLKKGIQALERSVDLNPNYAPAHYQLGLADMKRGWFKKAIISLIKTTELYPDYYPANNALGEAYYALNQYEEAIIEFNKAIKQKPNFATAHFNLGNAIYRRGALAEIVDSFWALLELQYGGGAIFATNGNSSDFESPLQGLEGLREKSRIEDTSQILRDMIRAYRTALSYDNSFYEASYNLALTYENLGNPDSAAYFYQKAISQNSELSQAHMRLGKLQEAQKKYDQALRSFKRVVEIEPSYFAANSKLGEPYRYINIIETVLNEKVAILENQPRDKDALMVVGKIYLSLGRFGQAEEYFQQLVDLSPNDMLAQQTLREIRRKMRKL